MAEIIINGKECTFEKGETVLDVAERNGIHIPTLCYLKEVTPIGACRLCLVQVDGAERLQSACTLYALDGMKIETDNEYIWKHRKQMLDFILIKHPLDCPICDKAGECMLQDTAYEFGMMEETISSEKPNEPKAYWNKIVYNSNLCVLCERCMKSCREMTGCAALDMEDRGFNNHVVPSKGETLDCDFCGTCIDRCPVGALLDNQFHHSARVWDLNETSTASPFSASEGDVVYGVRDGKIERGRSVEDSQISSQGRFAYSYIYNKTRVSAPLLKSGDEFSAKSWEEIEECLKDKNAGEKTALVMGSRLTNEAMAAYTELMKKLGSDKIITEADFNKAVYMKKYKEKFATYSNIGTLEDLKGSELTFVIGSDLRREAIGLKWKVMNAVVHNECKLVTVGLRKYEYDVFTDKSLMADQGNFARVLEEIKKGEGKKYEEIREYIAGASKISFIVGSEYTQAEDQLEAVFAFADFVGKDKLHCFFNANDKTNTDALYRMGLFGGGYTPAKLAEDIESKKAETVILAGFNNTYSDESADRLEDALKHAENVIAVDLFKDGSSSAASVILPAKAALETEGTFTKIDGRVAKVNKVTESVGEEKADVEIASIIAKAFGVELPCTAEDAFNSLVSGKNGYPAVSYNEVDGCLYAETASSYNETPYTFDEKPRKAKEIRVKPKYHSGTITVKANFDYEDEQVSREFHFKPEKDVIASANSSFSGKFTESEDVAKGIALIPEKY
ncbi:molybdopterin-dependent oxidoreductase [Limisalsivibrio acetivorans]|uniref:molybdopterin-dependent oxidoreductase n=1 Tax=Limisalsivibrio acetivorans TaxID=1304888 RepID=UPI0003B5B3AD|nr:molybdopterin-dependent oxidoreductase [Limisalsivibrio acetivorans]